MATKLTGQHHADALQHVRGASDLGGRSADGGLAVVGAVLIELGARRSVPLKHRQDHNAVAGPMFTVIGTTYAVLLAFVDHLLGLTVWEHAGRRPCATIHSNMQFVDAVSPGDLIGIGVAVVRSTRSVVFMRGDLTVGSGQAPARPAPQ